MEYTRSIGDHYESFEGTPQEIIELTTAMDKKGNKTPKIKIPRVKFLSKIIHEPIVPTVVKQNPLKYRDYKVSDYTVCSCGAHGCDLHKKVSERG